MTVVLSPVGNGQQFFLFNGLPNNGGFINTYLAGSSTPATTYTTSAGNVQNANPIPILAGGVLANEIWFTSGISYKFVITDSAGSVIQTLDNLTGINDLTSTIALIAATLVTFASSLGATMIGFIHAGVGAVLRTLQARLRDTTHATDYGAVCDGTTDDWAAITAAITSMTSGTLLIPGNTKISNPIVMKTNVNILATGTVDATGCSSAFNWTGTSVSTTTLTAQANEYDVSVAVTSVAGLSAGDYVILENSSFHTFPGTFAGIDSHLSMIEAISGSNVILNNPVPATFPIASSLLRKVTMIQNANVNVKKIIGAPTDAFYFKWAFNNVCEGGVDPINKNAVLFFSAFNNRGVRIIGNNPPANTAPGYGYGVLYDFGASDNSIEKSYFNNVRENSFGFSARRNAFRKNVVVRPYDSGANTHGLGSVDSIIEDNFIFNGQQYGIAIGQAATSGWWPDVGTKVRRNKIYMSQQTGIREQQFDAAIETRTVIEENDLFNVGIANIANFNHGIAILGSATGTSVVNPQILQNRIRTTGSAGGIGIYITGASAQRCNIDGNNVDTTGGSGIRWDSSGGGHIADNNTVRNAGERGFQSAGDERIIFGYNNIVYSSNLAAYLRVGAEVPTAGTWVVGDVVPNKIPTSGGVESWVCVAAGTPGTWVARSYLSINGSAAYDPPNLAAGAADAKVFAVSGATLTDYVQASFSLDLQGMVVTGYVQSAGFVVVYFYNGSGAPLDLASGTVYVRLTKRN